MPAHKRPRGNHHERFFPVEKPGPEDQRQACRIAQAARPDLVISVVSQLLTQEQDLRCDGRSRTGGDTQELQSIAQQFPEDRKAGAEVTLPNASKRRHGRSASHKARTLNKPTARSFNCTASSRESMIQGKFEILLRPPLTGPATPKHAECAGIPSVFVKSATISARPLCSPLE